LLPLGPSEKKGKKKKRDKNFFLSPLTFLFLHRIVTSQNKDKQTELTPPSSSASHTSKLIIYFASFQETP
jgi:hypothetical protein